MFACALFLLVGTVSDAGPSADEVFLGNLEGKWDMVGTVRGKPVRYTAEGQRLLQGAFLRIHMIDANVPPQYEANVYVGFDPEQHDYVVHWLDKFGAAGARVVATGQRQGERLIVHFPYTQGAFRNTWTHLPEADAWTLVIEAQKPDGHWSMFAEYRLTRRR